VSGDSAEEVEPVAVQPVPAAATTSVAIARPKGCDRVGTGPSNPFHGSASRRWLHGGTAIYWTLCP
jgi:hypothetical protein